MGVFTRRLLVFSALAGVLLPGCSGAGQIPRDTGWLPGASVAAAGASEQRTIPTTLTIRIPKKVRVGGRRSHFVSPATQSATIAIAPAASCKKCSAGFTRNLGLTPSSTGCKATATGTVCTLSYALAPGRYSGSMTTYDGALNASGTPTGSVLSLNKSFPLTIKRGKANAPGIDLYGVPAGLACLAVSASTLLVESTNPCNGGIFVVAPGVTSTLAMYAVDVDGNLMLGPGAPTFTASSSGGYAYATLGNIISITPPSLNSGFGPVTFKATSPACTAAGAVCSFSGDIAFDSVVAIANVTNNTVAIFPHLAIAAGAGRAYATVSTGISGPVALAFDKNGNLFVVNGNNNTVTEYAPPYSGAPIATISQKLNLPFALSIAQDGTLAVANGGTATVELYTPPYSSAPNEVNVSTYPTALALDSTDNLWVAWYTLSEVGRYHKGGVYFLDTLLNNGSNGISHPTALALDSADNLFVGDGKIDKFLSPSYSGSPAYSTGAIANINQLALDGTHGDIGVCAQGQDEVYAAFNLAFRSGYVFPQATCELAFDRFHNVELAFSSPDQAETLTYDFSINVWTSGKTFTSTLLAGPDAIAAWP